MMMTIGVRVAMEAIIPGRRARGPDRMKAEDRLLLLGRLLLLHLWHLLMVEVIRGRHLGVVLLLLPRHLPDTREAGEAHPSECQLDFTMMFETILFLQSKMPRLSPILSLIEAINIRWNA